MREITPDDEIRAAQVALEAEVFDRLIDACRAEPPICAVHERLKIAYIEHITALKREIAGGNLSRTSVVEMERIGKWIFAHIKPRDKESMGGEDELCEVLNGALTWPQVARVIEDATESHQGPSAPISMSMENMLRACQMHEDGATWYEVCAKYEHGDGSISGVDRMLKRLKPLLAVIDKHCPKPKQKK